MRIITLIKPIPDLSNISISKSQQKIFENNPPIFNPVDENTIELSLSIKDSHQAEVLAITFCPSAGEKILHQALSMGADQAYLINEDNSLIEDCFAKAVILAEVIKKIGGFDLIIAGSGSITGNGGQTGPRIAEWLNIPQITQVKNIKLKENRIIAEKFTDINLIITQEEKLPCLLTVATGINKPRLPSALAVIKAGKKEITKLKAGDLNFEPPLKKTSEIIRTNLA